MSRHANQPGERVPLTTPDPTPMSPSTPNFVQVSSPLSPTPLAAQRGVSSYSRSGSTTPTATMSHRNAYTSPQTPSASPGESYYSHQPTNSQYDGGGSGGDVYGPYPGSLGRGSRPGSSLSMSTAGGFGGSMGQGGARGSMILYRLAADEPVSGGSSEALLPPRLSHLNRQSTYSTSGDSTYSIDDSSSKYGAVPRGMVPYAYDPSTDEQGPTDEEDDFHDPTVKGSRMRTNSTISGRGLLNVGALIFLTLGILMLFVFLPVWDHIMHNSQRLAMSADIHVNASGQAAAFFSLPSLIDQATPEEARSRVGTDGEDYVLVFSDEFEEDGRTFYPGEDPFWEAADIWYGATADLEWYDPRQITTRDGNLVITIDSVTTTQPGLTPGSSAPFLQSENHGLAYRSGMLQSWNKFCFTTGYIEVSVILPGPDENTKGYWPGVWTMGNLGRPGYAATTDGMWPYTYDSCDVGTFPNQTNPDGQTPAAAIFSEEARDRYNNELSWLPGQRLSACSCPNSDHPGPTTSKGRGSPEIDVFEAEADKHSETGIGHIISQSAQFAPFSHDYFFDGTTEDKYVIRDNEKTMRNTYKGSAIQQSVSTLSKLPSDGFWGLDNRRHVVYGFEYWSNPSNRDEGYITWISDGVQDVRVGATAMGPDPEENGGSGVGQRIIPEEPMSVVLNVGISENWQDVDPSTMVFPTEMLVEYVRIYQRKGSENIGCDPKEYPTMKYIEDHLEAYMNPNMTTWDWPIPVNSLYNQGQC